MERIGFWLIVLAAMVVVLVLSGIILPPVVGGIITGVYVVLRGRAHAAKFEAAVRLGELRCWAARFPVLSNSSDSEVWRLAGVNAALVFFFAFIYHVLASTFMGGFLAGLIVVIAFAALGIFYNRARKVVIQAITRVERKT